MLGAMLFGVLVVAVLIGSTAASRRVSCWWLFLVACIAGTPQLVEAQLQSDRACHLPQTDVLPSWLLATSLAVSLALYGAAVLGGIMRGVRQADVQGGGGGAPFLRSVVCPLASAAGAFAVLVASLSGLRCIS